MKPATFSILAIVAMAFAFQPLSNGATGDDQSAGRDLGTTEGKPVTNGFVFIDGKYIEPPYTVTRQGTGILINGHLVEQPCPWPIPEKTKPAIPTEDPTMPEAITRNSTQHDKDLIAYLGKKKAYYRNEYGEKEMVKKMIKVYQDMPCVVKASPGQDEDHLSVTWIDGTTMEHRLILPKRKPTEWTRETVLARTDNGRANYEDRLSKGDYFFLGSVHGRMTGTAEGAGMVLGALLPILKTSKDAKEVQEGMVKAGFVFFDDRAAQAFFSHRRDLSNLESRLNKLRQDKP
jgi:hypothetical protein